MKRTGANIRFLIWAIVWLCPNPSLLAATGVAESKPVQYAILCDDASDLCWQDPQRKAYDQSDQGLPAAEAGRYCAELELDGYKDWRLPDSDELRGLIAGNPATESGGQCKLTIGQARNETGWC